MFECVGVMEGMGDKMGESLATFAAFLCPGNRRINLTVCL